MAGQALTPNFKTRAARWVAFLGLMAISLGSARAQARKRKSEVRRFLECGCHHEVLYLNPGITFGGALNAPVEGNPAMVLGGELSLVFLGPRKHSLFGGVVVDGVYDWKRQGARVMAGAVFGWRFVGIDGGYVVDFSAGGPHHGGAVRVFATLGALSFYVRYGVMKGTADFGEMGLLVKLPLPVWSR